MKFAVTVGKGDATGLIQNALAWSKQLEVDFIPRAANGTLDALLKEHSLTALIVATANGPEIYSLAGRLFFHPGMGILRIKNIMEGKGDRLVEAMELKEGMQVLDCTLGLCADALVASFVTGSTGKVVGLEASLPVAFTMQKGIKKYEVEDQAVCQALRRIKVVYDEAGQYLKTLPDTSFDVIYFDPMFDYSVDKSSNMKPLRPLACQIPLAKAVFAEAKRVARKKVVVKVVKGSKLSLTEDFTFTNDGRYSKIKYAVWERPS